MRLISIVFVLASLAACGPQLSVVVPPAEDGCATLHGDPGITARLYFGRTMKDGGRIDDAAWRTFLAERVTPRLPSGFSVFEGYGQWQQRSGGRIIQEPSTVIEVAAPRNAATIWKLEEIRADYRQMFNQESVGMVISESCASF
ncbi:MAG: DUF3574 domain-containing protein [Acetobacteraceae bacterium]|nr:DUF3574 domain-containing protein [Acetobacteraceae bacterium]